MFKILMNALVKMIAIGMPLVQILMDHIIVTVILDMLETARRATVSNRSLYRVRLL